MHRKSLPRLSHEVGIRRIGTLPEGIVLRLFVALELVKVRVLLLFELVKTALCFRHQRDAE